MKTIIICPNQANGVPVLADSKPLITLPILGENFISYWFEHLAGRQVKEARLVTTDEVEALDEITSLASRWGVNVELFHEVRDLSVDEARKRYRPAYETDWPEMPADVVEIDHLPGSPELKLFSSYARWFEAVHHWMEHVTRGKRIGLREIMPGVWAGRRTRISGSAKLKAPCWLGDNVRVAKDAVIGPFAYLEDQVVAEEGCEILNSWVGPDTLIGVLTRLEDSLAWGSTLINWETGSSTQVPDSFLMCSLAQPRRKERRMARKPAVTVESPLARPLEAVISLAQKLQG